MLETESVILSPPVTGDRDHQVALDHTDFHPVLCRMSCWSVEGRCTAALGLPFPLTSANVWGTAALCDSEQALLMKSVAEKMLLTLYRENCIKKAWSWRIFTVLSKSFIWKTSFPPRTAILKNYFNQELIDLLSIESIILNWSGWAFLAIFFKSLRGPLRSYAYGSRTRHLLRVFCFTYLLFYIIKQCSETGTKPEQITHV